MNSKKKNKAQEKYNRLAVINHEKCKPKKCNLECKRSCPPNQMGKQCIDVENSYKLAKISEDLCIGCGICIKKCPFNAINIINIPAGLKKDLIHQFHENSFRIHRLPQIKPNIVLGIIGRNGIGKSTAMKIFTGKLTPNLGDYVSTNINYDKVIQFYKGSTLQNYFKQIKDKNIKVVMKPQYVMQLKARTPGKVKDYIKKFNNLDDPNLILTKLELNHLLNREVKNLSGGECQRFAIAISLLQNKDMYIFDEPTSYLDVKQRIIASQMIRNIFENFKENTSKYVLAVEHDLAILDYLSDNICCMYGTPSAYGVVSSPFNVRDGINIYLKGFIPTENIRFRSNEFNFKFKTEISYEEDNEKSILDINYPDKKINLGNDSNKFQLEIEKGFIKKGETLILLGENGTGKSTFCNEISKMFESASYKPQNIEIIESTTVYYYLLKKIGNTINDNRFRTDIWIPLEMENIKDNMVTELSGGEQQRLAICECLGMKTDLYILDEPCAFLDCEQRMNLSNILKRFVVNNKKQAIIVEHDLSICTFIADKVVLFEGVPGKECKANKPCALKEGMNKFLKNINVTFRKDDVTHRPRINKLNSVKDSEQKKEGNYFIF